jgi:hypothetical protein
MNIASVVVAILGSYRARVYFDLVFRQYTAFCMLDAADRAAKLGLKRISVVEFGVASGAGILNICDNASAIRKATGNDCHDACHNPSCGEMLACQEFNKTNELRQIFPYTALREKRLLKRASWVSKISARSRP